MTEQSKATCVFLAFLALILMLTACHVGSSVNITDLKARYHLEVGSPSSVDTFSTERYRESRYFIILEYPSVDHANDVFEKFEGKRRTQSRRNLDEVYQQKGFLDISQDPLVVIKEFSTSSGHRFKAHWNGSQIILEMIV